MISLFSRDGRADDYIYFSDVLCMTKFKILTEMEIQYLISTPPFHLGDYCVKRYMIYLLHF